MSLGICGALNCDKPSIGFTEMRHIALKGDWIPMRVCREHADRIAGDRKATPAATEGS